MPKAKKTTVTNTTAVKVAPFKVAGFKVATPKAAPKHAAPKHAAPKHVSKVAPPKAAAPKAAAPKHVSKVAPPKAAAPKSAPKSAPKAAAPKVAAPKGAPKAAAPKMAAPKVAAPKHAAAKPAPKVAAAKPAPKVAAAKSAPKAAASKTVLRAEKAAVAAPDSTLAPDAREAYDHFLPVALHLESAALVPYRSAEPALAHANVQLGVAAVLAQRAHISEHLPRVPFTNITSLPRLALAVQYAALKADEAPTPRDIATRLQAAHALRATLLAIADGLSHAGLVPSQDVAHIRKGTGPLDAAADCVALADLFTKYEKKIGGKHAATAQMLRSSREVGSYLLGALKPGRARDAKAVNGPATEARDRLWSLLVQRHKELRKVGYYLWDDSFSEHVPALLSHKSAKKPAPKKPVAAPKGAPPITGG